MAGRTRTRGAALLVAFAFVALTGATVVVLARAEGGHAVEKRSDDARAAALRAADAVQTLLGALEAQVQNGTSNPRLVAALDARVDAETLRDLLLNEPWWESFRRSTDGFALYTADAQPIVSSRLPAGFDARTLVREARAASRARAALTVAAGQVLVVAAAPIPLGGRSIEPALVSVRALDAEALGEVAERAGARVALSDGTEALLVANPKRGGPAGGSPALARGFDLPLPGVGIFDGYAVAAVALPGDARGDLRILAVVAAPPGTWAARLPGGAIGILVVGMMLAIGSFTALAGPRGRKKAPRDARGTAAASPIAGRYTLVSRLGEGGMAEIYSAVTTGVGTFRRPVVIKRLKPELAADPNAVAQFRDEANLLAAFNHPNIVAVHDFGRWDNRFFLAEEYVAGRNLGRVVEQCFARTGRPPAPELVAYVAREVLKALDYAHRMENGEGRPLKIVHRDISPENVVVTPQGEVKLLDFGIVKAAEGRITKTEIGMVKGNVSFMAPEQARGLEVDGRADLYALALVLFFCLTGRALYAADNVYERLMQAATGPGANERALFARLPRPFSTVIARATDPDLGRRYPSAREMAADLKNWAVNGATPTAHLVNELFGEELKEEARQLATFPTVESSRELVSYSSSDRG
ncbi:MAG TPA: serine/threonine-protein kinase [Polyangia bacterium]|nr:serine/threonine-protein kinase [Polyangia bacterium]